ncbi:MAG: endo-1,4-beta-xylanase [Planctomycetota bacterium]|jgi:GH35 family endo-1,4-beta-xylanase
MKRRTHREHDQTRRALLTRRGFLRATSTSLGLLAAAPYISYAGQDNGPQSDADVLGQADERIKRHRMAAATLKLVGPDGKAFPAGRDVKITQTRHKFLFGCNIFKLGRCRTPEDNAAYEKQFAELLNFATLPFYWWNYERQKGKPQDARTEEIVRWCKTHNLTTKGHPLAWNWGDPSWLTGTPEEVMQLQLKRIERCVKLFKGDIDIWDVVNEATHYDREGPKERAPRLTEAIAKMGVGEYVRAAFKKARQANPDATLLINDYRTDPAYADKVISKLVDQAGRPLYDVIGIQSHMHGQYWGAQRAWEVCERHAKFGKPLHFTETTVVSGPKKPSGWTTTAEGERRQARLVAEFYTVLFAHPAVEAITWWDFTDQNAWQGAPAGLVRDDMSPKPAYERLHDLIKGKWWTQIDAQTASDGNVNLRGFLGDYRVLTKQGDRRLTGKFTIRDSPATPVEVRLA